MPFPEVKRVIYERNPLDRVICQLRFPPILKIDAEIPAEFQDRVRNDFPNYSETWELRVVPQEIRAEIPDEVFRQLTQSSGTKNHEFSSEDDRWKVNLTRTFIALTANRYERWEEFKDKLADLLSALIDLYSPAYFSRVGLRYVNVIRRSELNLRDASWSELLQPYILGILGSPGVGNHIQNFESRYEIRLSDGESIVKTITAFIEADDGERCYVIDSDFSNTNKTGIDATMEKLDCFNSRGSRLFQWCITDRLHQAMEPQAL